MANGSLYELETQLQLAGRFNFVDNDFVEEMLNRIDEIQKMNYGLQTTLKKSIKQ